MNPRTYKTFSKLEILADGGSFSISTSDLTMELYRSTDNEEGNLGLSFYHKNLTEIALLLDGKLQKIPQNEDGSFLLIMDWAHQAELIKLSFVDTLPVYLQLFYCDSRVEA